MSEPIPEVAVVSSAHRQRAIRTILLGFSADPLMRWFWPDPNTYFEAESTMDLLAGDGVDLGAALEVNGFSGVALWLPPGYELEDDPVIAAFQSSVAQDRQENLFQMFAAIDEYHPKYPHWYLSMIAIDPFCQGQGLGSALMKHAVARCDAEGLPAFLESSNPRNISLYERYGFEPMGQIQIGDSPLVTPMLRTPR